MKHTPKKDAETYSFEEYKKRFPPPSPPRENELPEEPAESGAKLAERSLAKVRQQARQP